ncbi:MAG TPA: DUF4102 domain-containing protein [Thermodesulforhabdus norvegica]|uniref:DUF4102 domain-containing protein n=1 Tax=Thermodesulforhabdus norvegica TaxID=39841 RepID=A0A7C0WTS6_9BACT|nr:DUF4102 domain-containing protein [Thermodesulforhabdus norvegica]
MLTELKIRNAKPKEKPYKLYDSHGLFLQVYPNGSKLWRFKYIFAGKHKLISLGRYPVVSLAKAREKRNEARQMLLEGIDPSIERQKRKSARLVTFARVANEWYENVKHRWTKAHANKVWYRMNKYAIKKIGRLPTIKYLQSLSNQMKAKEGAAEIDYLPYLLQELQQINVNAEENAGEQDNTYYMSSYCSTWVSLFAVAELKSWLSLCGEGKAEPR